MVKKDSKHKKNKQNKQAKINVGRVLDPAHLLFYAHRLCMNFMIAMLLLASCMRTHDHVLGRVMVYSKKKKPDDHKVCPITGARGS